MRRKLSKMKQSSQFLKQSLSLFTYSISVRSWKFGNNWKGVIASVSVQNEVSQKKIKQVTSLTRCTSLKIQLSREPLLLQFKKSQLRWFGHVSALHQEKLPNELYLPKQMKKKQLDDLKLLQMNQYYIEDLGWNCLGLHPSEMMGVMENREVW